MVKHMSPKIASIKLFNAALDDAEDGRNVVIRGDNLRAFFGLIDQCWGIRGIQYREGVLTMSEDCARRKGLIA